MIFRVDKAFNVSVTGEDVFDRSVYVTVDETEGSRVTRVRAMSGAPCNVVPMDFKVRGGYRYYLHTYGTYEVVSQGETRYLEFTREDTTIKEEL